jgi:hypothetical protein
MSFSSVKISGAAAMPDRVYYNATIINNTISTSQASDDPAIRFADTRQIPIVPDASKYDVSVEFFELNGATKSLPILIPQIIPRNTATITAVTWSNQEILITQIAWELVGSNTVVTFTYSIGSTAIVIVGDSLGVSGLTGDFAQFNGTYTVSATGSSSLTVTINSFTASPPNQTILPVIGGLLTTANANYTSLANFTCNNWFQVGDVISSIQGLTTTATVLNFTTPTSYVVVAATPTTFSLYYPPSVAAGTESGQSGIVTNATRRDPTDINSTAYFLTVAVYTGTSYDTYCSGDAQVVWEPENVTPFTQVPVSATPQIETDYYYCYTYSHWVYLLNKALVVAWNNAINIAASLGSPFGTQCPFFEFDQTSGLFSLNQDANTSLCPVGVQLPPPFSTTFAPTGAYEPGEYSFVGMNSNLEGLMTNFSTIYYAVGPEWRTSGENLPEVVVNMGLTNLNVTTGSVTGDNCINVLKGLNPTSFFLTNPFTNNETTQSFVKLTQDFVSTGSLWSPITSFVLLTTQIPVRNEGLANPLTLGNANIGTQNSSSGSFQRVLLETPINAVTADIWRGWVLYQPLTTTISSLEDIKDGIVELDLYLYWRNRLTNSLVPVRLYNTGTMTFRLLFQKRSV